LHCRHRRADGSRSRRQDGGQEDAQRGRIGQGTYDPHVGETQPGARQHLVDHPGELCTLRSRGQPSERAGERDHSRAQRRRARRPQRREIALARRVVGRDRGEHLEEIGRLQI